MYIYLEDYGIIEQKVATLTKRLFDSDEYKIVILPEESKSLRKRGEALNSISLDDI